MNYNLGKVDPKFQNIILNLSQTIKGVDVNKVESIFKKYVKIPEELKNLNSLKIQLKRTYPRLFNKDIIINDKKIISYENQETSKQRIIKEKNLELGLLDSLDKIESYLADTKNQYQKLKNEFDIFFPEKDFEQTHRIKDPENIVKAIEKKKTFPLGDVIGLRIIAKNAYSVLKIIGILESKYGENIYYKTNSFAYNQKNLLKLKRSRYYRAIHYHIPAGNYIAEIQVRTPAINQWSHISRYTEYEKKIKIDHDSKLAIKEFGKITNIVDYFSILKN